GQLARHDRAGADFGNGTRRRCQPHGARLDQVRHRDRAARGDVVGAAGADGVGDVVADATDREIHVAERHGARFEDERALRTGVVERQPVGRRLYARQLASDALARAQLHLVAGYSAALAVDSPDAGTNDQVAGSAHATDADGRGLPRSQWRAAAEEREVLAAAVDGRVATDEHVAGEGGSHAAAQHHEVGGMDAVEVGVGQRGLGVGLDAEGIRAGARTQDHRRRAALDRATGEVECIGVQHHVARAAAVTDRAVVRQAIRGKGDRPVRADAGAAADLQIVAGSDGNVAWIDYRSVARRTDTHT